MDYRLKCCVWAAKIHKNKYAPWAIMHNVNKINEYIFYDICDPMEPTKFSIVEARFTKGQQITFFLLGTLLLIGGISLLTVFINRKLGVQFRMQPLAFLVFFIFEYFLSSVVFASKAKGTIDFDDHSIKIEMANREVKNIAYADLEKIHLGKGTKTHFLASAKTPRIYTVTLYLNDGNTVKLKIENQVQNRQSLMPAKIHEISEKLRIPLER